jgi:DNA replication and repair protein RecF
VLTSLVVRGFRNLAHLELGLAAGPTLVLGDNGAGKTSLLEAVYALSTTKSFRSKDLGECLAHGGDAFSVSGELTGARRTRLSLDWSPRRLERAVNGKATSLRQHLEVQAVLAWTAADGPLWAGPAEDRRRFLDRGMVAVAPADLELLARYREALRQKRLWLVEKRAPSARARLELASWNEVLAGPALALAQRRRLFLGELEAALVAVMGELDLADLEPPALVLRSSPAELPTDRDAMLAALEAVADDEIRLQRTRLGPHRDDLEVWWRRRRARAQASAGERKAIGLLLVAAQARLAAAAGRPAILLLDDLDAELDRGRLAALWPALAAAPQILASSSRPEVFAGMPDPPRLRLEAGRLVRG